MSKLGKLGARQPQPKLPMNEIWSALSSDMGSSSGKAPNKILSAIFAAWLMLQQVVPAIDNSTVEERMNAQGNKHATEEVVTNRNSPPCTVSSGAHQPTGKHGEKAKPGTKRTSRNVGKHAASRGPMMVVRATSRKSSEDRFGARG